MANASDTANEAAVMIACFPGAKVNLATQLANVSYSSYTQFDANMYAALTDISATAASGRYYHTFKPQATKLVAAAKSAGRLNADGTVNTAALVAPKASPRGKKSAGTLNGTQASFRKGSKHPLTFYRRENW